MARNATWRMTFRGVNGRQEKAGARTNRQEDQGISNTRSGFSPNMVAVCMRGVALVPKRRGPLPDDSGHRPDLARPRSRQRPSDYCIENKHGLAKFRQPPNRKAKIIRNRAADGVFCASNPNVVRNLRTPAEAFNGRASTSVS
jgi:hypothetical protein